MAGYMSQDVYKAQALFDLLNVYTFLRHVEVASFWYTLYIFLLFP